LRQGSSGLAILRQMLPLHYPTGCQLAAKATSRRGIFSRHNNDIDAVQVLKNRLFPHPKRPVVHKKAAL
ncbi:MAG: hypothetical protein LBE58_16380, partial [Comamonas sp.]|nr:hypothetical protein [Comamonas sp.]